MLTWRLDPLHDLFRISPKTEQTFRGNIRAANLGKGIKGTEFQFKKERILILCHLLENISGLDRGQIRTLADAVLIRRDTQTVLGLLKASKKEDKGSTSGGYLNLNLSAAKERVKSTFGISKVSKPTREEAMWRDATNFASSVSDSDFLSQLNTTPIDECLHVATVEAEEAAYVYLEKLIKSLVDGIGQQIFGIQKAECDKQIKREITSGEDKELGIVRSDFVHQVEDLTRERSRSYVHYSFG